MTFAVTAVTGQLGRTIAQTLADKVGPTQVVGLARTPSRAQGLNLDIRPGDYDRPDQLAASLADVDAVLLVSGMAPPEDRIHQHRNVINAAKSAGVRKIVFTSIQGPETGTAFSPIVQSNRQTEADIRASGLEWSIGRNGIYIEPDVDYIDSYRAKGEVANSAGNGKCGYTTRPELAHAYTALLTQPEYQNQTVNLNGTPITQAQLTAYLNGAFGTQLTYRSMSPADCATDRTTELGGFLGPVIAGIYEGIRLGAYDTPGDFKTVTGRPHQGWDAYFKSIARKPRRKRRNGA